MTDEEDNVDEPETFSRAFEECAELGLGEPLQ
jgi:hypothetical protein